MSSDAALGVTGGELPAVDELVRPRGERPSANAGSAEPSARPVAVRRCAEIRGHRLRAATRVRRCWLAANTLAAAVAILWSVSTGRYLTAGVVLTWLAMEGRAASNTRNPRQLLALTPMLQRVCGLGIVVAVGGVIFDRALIARQSLWLLAAVTAAPLAARAIVAIRPLRLRWHLHSGPESVVVVGNANGVRRLTAALHDVPDVSVVGAFTSLDGGETVVNEVPVLGHLEDVITEVPPLRASRVMVVAGDVVDDKLLTQLQWALEPTDSELVVVTPLADTNPHRIRVRRHGRHTVLSLVVTPPRGIAAFAKSTIERVLATTLLLLSAPLLLTLMAVVRLDTPGPALFRQTRIRDGGRRFTMLKLRTMGVDAERRREQLQEHNESDGSLFKIRADPRITRSGRLLRKLSLDELPQLLNVIRGDMALIGPRPPLPEEVARYDTRAMRRLTVKPGLTGLWQVSGRSDLSWEETVRLDIDYVDNWTPARDAAIAARTAGAVMSRRGAY